MDKPNSNFESQWQGAFGAAELVPSEQVWNKIDASLTSGESGKFRKRLLVLQLMTAASLALAIGIGGVNFFWDQSAPAEQQTTQESLSGADKDVSATTEVPAAIDSTEQKNSTVVAENEPEQGEMVESRLADENSGQEEEDTDIIKDAKDRNNVVANIDTDKREHVASAEEFSVPGEQLNAIANLDWLPESHLQLSDPEIYGIPLLPETVVKEKESSSLWAGLKMSANSFDPNFGESTGLSVNEALSNPQNIGASRMDNMLSQDPSFSYSFGFNVGKQIARKWILQGGLQYAVQNADASSSLFAESSALGTRTPLFFYNNSFDAGAEAQASPEPIDLTNTFEFVSIPVQVGYILLDGKFSWAVNTGISTSIFLKNTIADRQNAFNEIALKPGASTPFRTVHLNGLLGTEFIYKLGGNYMISLEPNYQLSISALTKPGQSFGSRPRSLGLGVRLKYIFK